MSEFKSSNFRNEDGSGGPDIVGVTTFTSPYYFVPPSGTTAQRPSDPAPGMLRFNEDIGRLEVWRNDHWATILSEPSAPIGGRGLFGGGNSNNTIDYITITTTGNAIDFGDLTVARSMYQGGCSSVIRGLFGGGYAPGSSNVIDYITISTLGNAIDFGDLTAARFGVGAFSDSTRGVWGNGMILPNNSNIIDYVTITSTGNAQDFGDATVARRLLGSFSSRTRGVWGGGENPGLVNVIDYITIQSTGNASDFGDLSTTNTQQICGLSNNIRGIFYSIGVGPGTPAQTNTMEYITISTTGNAVDFGDTYVAITGQPGGTSNPTRGIIAGGQIPATPSTAIIQHFAISTLGNTQNFGDLTQARSSIGACSNGHGGL